ncbi:MAG: DUF2304 domain-containing protein, partial [Kiritimatiellia bacterium]|nr:DUF2304 domain-containing protein [Kiritimatiellia bacterium]
MTPPQMISAGVGCLLCLGSLFVFVRRRTGRFRALIWLFVGAVLVYAAYRPTIIELMGEDSDLLRLRWMVGLLSLVVLTVALEAIRISRMQERYALLWMAAGACLLVGSVSTRLSDWATRLTGMSYVVIVGVGLISFMLLLLFHLSVALSHQRDQ